MKNLIYLALLAKMATMFMSTTAYNWRDEAICEAVTHQTCAKTHLYYFCVEALKSIPHTRTCKTPLDIARSLIHLLGHQASDVGHNLSSRLGSGAGIKKGTFKDKLFACIDMYDKMYTVDYYNATDNMRAKNYKVAEQRLLMAYKRAQDCEAGFQQIRKLPIMFLKQNSNTCRLALVAAGATHSLIL